MSPTAMRIRLERLGLLLREAPRQTLADGWPLTPFFEENVKCQLDRRITRTSAGESRVRDTRLLSRLLPALHRLRALDLRAEGRRKVFVFRDRPTRRDDVMAFYGDGAAVPPLAFASTIKDMKALLHNA